MGTGAASRNVSNKSPTPTAKFFPTTVRSWWISVAAPSACAGLHGIVELNVWYGRADPAVPGAVPCSNARGWDPGTGETGKKNGLRHSFISYRVADIQDVNQVALECGKVTVIPKADEKVAAVAYPRLAALVPLLQRRGQQLLEREASNFELPTHPGLILKESYWPWPQRALAGNTIYFFVQVFVECRRRQQFDQETPPAAAGSSLSNSRFASVSTICSLASLDFRFARVVAEVFRIRRADAVGRCRMDYMPATDRPANSPLKYPSEKHHRACI